MFPFNIHDVLTCWVRHSDDVMRYSTSADVSHSTDTVLWTLCSAVKLEHFCQNNPAREGTLFRLRRSQNCVTIYFAISCFILGFVLSLLSGEMFHTTIMPGSLKQFILCFIYYVITRIFSLYTYQNALLNTRCEFTL